MRKREPSLKQRCPAAVERPARGGFTLTEMLVATALVLMILLIFAQIYQAAVRTVREQRGLAQNDARARMLATLLRDDLDRRTFRDNLLSTARGLQVLGPGATAASEQKGYFLYSENDPENDSDDVLQITVRVDTDELGFLGKASQIGRPSTASSGVGAFNSNDRNQPEFDDGDSGNGVTRSTAAEVCYFVRNGTLYRRILLLREPLSTPSTMTYTADPTMNLNGAGGDLIPDIYGANADVAGSVNGDFWNDFDSSAYCYWDDLDGDDQVDAAGTDNFVLRFNGINALDNTISDVTDIARHRNRFGFGLIRPTTATPRRHWRPREYVGTNTFIGRFLHEETSHQDFAYPGNYGQTPTTAGTHPYERTDLTLNTRGIVTQFAGGDRAGEDLVLPNVDAFDVKIWDPAGGSSYTDSSWTVAVERKNGAFVNAGYGRASDQLAGYFDHHRNLRKDYGGRNVDRTGADGQPGRSGVDDDGNGATDDESEVGWPGSDDIISRTFDTWYVTDTSVATDGLQDSYTTDDGEQKWPLFPHDYGANVDDWPAWLPLISQGPDYVPKNRASSAPAPGPMNQPNFWTYEDWNTVPKDLSTVSPQPSKNFPEGMILFPDGDLRAPIGYRWISGTECGTVRPSFANAIGDTVTETGVTDPVVWEAFDNRVGVTMIQITIRYRDVASNLPRQLTIRHSLTDGN